MSMVFGIGKWLALCVGLATIASCMRSDPVLSIDVMRDARRDGRRVAILTNDFFYCHPASGEVFRVPRFFETDFASIPPAAQAIISPFGNYTEAAVLHDWLYAVGEPGQREKADKIFRDAMAEQGVNKKLRDMMYEAVRLGGGDAYGAPREWRFTDPSTLARIEAPVPRPEKAAVTQIDCTTFEAQRARLHRVFGTQVRSAAR